MELVCNQRDVADGGNESGTVGLNDIVQVSPPNPHGRLVGQGTEFQKSVRTQTKWEVHVINDGLCCSRQRVSLSGTQFTKQQCAFGGQGLLGEMVLDLPELLFRSVGKNGVGPIHKVNLLYQHQGKVVAKPAVGPSRGGESTLVPLDGNLTNLVCMRGQFKICIIARPQSHSADHRADGLVLEMLGTFRPVASVGILCGIEQFIVNESADDTKLSVQMSGGIGHFLFTNCTVRKE